MQPRAYMYMCAYTYGYVGVYVRNLLLVLFLCRTLTDTIIFFSSNLPFLILSSPLSFPFCVVVLVVAKVIFGVLCGRSRVEDISSHSWWDTCTLFCSVSL